MANPLVAELTPARERILKGARDLFFSQGYARTSLRSISDAVGLSKAAVYHHFRAKDELLAAIAGPLVDGIDQVIADAGPPPAPAAQCGGLMAAYLDVLAAQPRTVALLRDPAVADHPVGRRFSAQHGEIGRMLGADDGATSVIRTTIALRALELAVVEFGEANPAEVRETALRMALAVLAS